MSYSALIPPLPPDVKARVVRLHRRAYDVVDIGEPLIDIQVGESQLTILSPLGGRISWFYELWPPLGGGQPFVEISSTPGVIPTDKIFLAYRQGDVPHLAGRIYERLVVDFGSFQVFMDQYSLRPGEDYRTQITTAISRAEVLVLVIGPGWLSGSDPLGKRRIDAPDDQHRLELEQAIARGLKILPILAEGAVMPSAAELPPELAALSTIQALRMSTADWALHSRRLREAVSGSLPHRENPSQPRP